MGIQETGKKHKKKLKTTIEDGKGINIKYHSSLKVSRPTALIGQTSFGEKNLMNFLNK